MIEKEAVPCVQALDRLYILRAQSKVEDVEVLGHPLLARRFRNGDNHPLDEPAEDYLGNAPLVLCRKANQQFVLEEIVPSFGKRSPGLHLHIVFPQEMLCLDLLVKGMGFNLIYRRHGFTESD